MSIPLDIDHRSVKGNIMMAVDCVVGQKHQYDKLHMRNMIDGTSAVGYVRTDAPPDVMTGILNRTARAQKLIEGYINASQSARKLLKAVATKECSVTPWYMIQVDEGNTILPIIEHVCSINVAREDIRCEIQEETDYVIFAIPTKESLT